MKLFAERTSKREVKFPMRWTEEERDFLNKVADERGIAVTSLVRHCIREALKPDIQQAEQAEHASPTESKG